MATRLVSQTVNVFISSHHFLLLNDYKDSCPLMKTNADGTRCSFKSISRECTETQNDYANLVSVGSHFNNKKT